MTDDLIARLEAAEEGSRELSELVAIAAGWRYMPEVKHCWKWQSPYGKDLVAPPDYTTSRDASLPGENIYAVRRNIDGTWTALHGVLRSDGAESGETTKATANTEAIARRVAALKARESEDGRS